MTLWLIYLHSGVRYLTKKKAGTSHPSYSPDGRFLAFLADKGEASFLWVRDLTTGEEVPLAWVGSPSPDWRSDGTCILITRWHDLAVIFPTRGNVQSVFKFPENFSKNTKFYSSCWSPDGRHIATIVSTASPTEKVAPKNIYIVTPQSSEYEKVTNFEGEEIAKMCGLSWSPDGKYIAFTKKGAYDDETDDWEFEIWYVEVATGKTVRVINNGRCGFPSWSPDGKTIAYFKSLPFQALGMPSPILEVGEIYLATVDGKHSEKVYDCPCGEKISWSPDGKKIAFGDGLRICEVEVRSIVEELLKKAQ